MGAVVSCIRSVFQTIGSILMAIVNGIGRIITAIVNGIVSLFDIVIGCLTCHRMGGRRRRRFGTRHAHARRAV